jgi:hypothetical protein
VVRILEYGAAIRGGEDKASGLLLISGLRSNDATAGAGKLLAWRGQFVALWSPGAPWAFLRERAINKPWRANKEGVSIMVNRTSHRFIGSAYLPRVGRSVLAIL